MDKRAVNESEGLIQMLSCRFYLMAGAVLATVGCSNSMSRISPPSLADAPGEEAVRQHDANGDGAIAGSELNSVPGLKAALPQVDTSKDGRVTAEEIDQRIETWRDSRVGLASCVITIRQRGQPVVGAQVTMVPEKFLGEAVKPAHGTTDKRGMARMQISAEPDETGAHVGFYRVEVSKMVAGKETIPSRYNSQTELGLELAADVFDSRNPRFEL